MEIPAVDSLWIDNDPRVEPTRFIQVLSAPDSQDRVECRTWYDESIGTARTAKLAVKRFQQLAGGTWSKTGYRPADREPEHGRPA
jgi:hypothetical protein